MMNEEPEGPTRVAVTELRLSDFRSHSRLQLATGGRSLAIVGANGAGKTNILEALSLLAPGRGFRRATFADLARREGSGGFGLSADVSGAYGDSRIAVTHTAGEPARQIRIDGEPVKSAEVLSDYLRVIWLVPSMDGLFLGPAGDRRRFLDRLVLTIDPAHGRRVNAYEAAVTARNRLLEERAADPAWLDAVEAQVAELGTAVAAARREAVACLTRLIATRGDDGYFPAATIALEGTLDEALAGAAASDVEDWFRADLKACRSRDRAAGRTLAGPHRSDLAVFHAAKAMPAHLCSTGEQKALLTGLMLAQAAMVADLAGLRPLLLFDEIAAHLDADRRLALFALIEALGGQAFLTGTDAAPFLAARDRLEIVGLSEAGGLFSPPGAG